MGHGMSRAGNLLLARTPLGAAMRCIPGLPGWHARHRLERRGHPGLFAGVYPSHEAALADIPAGRDAGWDTDDVAAIWVDCIAPMQLSTYASFFWLSQLLESNGTVVDYGGSIGLTYYAWRKLLPLPAGLRWVVVEVEAIVRQGRRVAEREQATGLEFFDDLSAAPRADVLFTAGALQYMPESVPGLFERLGYRPSYVLVNKLPLTSRDDYWSLQNFGPAVAPCRMFNEHAFLDYFSRHGYGVMDRWDVVDLVCEIPFHPEAHLDHFCGLLFRRND